MAKEKKDRKASLPQKSIHLRLAFLHQAASHIADHVQNNARMTWKADEDDALMLDLKSKTVTTQPRYLINQMKGVSRKSVIRLHKDVKRSVCKRCDELLAEDKNSTTEVENRSANLSKPWADILVIKCKTCGTSKRFPIGAKYTE